MGKRGGAAQPIVIDGTTYASHSAAARALGVTVSAISHRKERGFDGDATRLHVRITDQDTIALAHRLLARWQFGSIDELVTAAVQHMATHTDD